MSSNLSSRAKAEFPLAGALHEALLFRAENGGSGTAVPPYAETFEF
jgi:hypothetical protein